MGTVAVGVGDAGIGETPGNGGGGMEAELGAALGAGFDDVVGGDETPGGEAGGGPSQPQTPTEDTPAGEAPSSLDANARPNEQPAQTTPELPNGWAMSEDGKSLMVPSTELPRVQGALKYAEAVGQIFQSPQEAQVAAQGSSDMRQMHNDWYYGTDDAIRSVLQHWAGANHQDPGAKAAFQRSFGKMLSMAPEYLQQANPQAYQQFLGLNSPGQLGPVKGVAAMVVKAAYDRAAALGTPESLTDAQSVEWGLTGQYQDKLPQADPVAMERQRFEQERKDFQGRQDAAYRRDVQDFNAKSVEGAKLGQLDQSILKVLAPIKDRYSEVALNDMVSGIHREVMDTIAKQNPDWYTEHKQSFDQLINDYRQTWQGGNPAQGLQPRIQHYITDFLNRAGRIMPAIAQRRVNATSSPAPARQRATQPAANRPAPATSSAPQTNGQGRSKSEQFDKEFSALFR